MSRLISHSETASLLDCQAKWDFGYGGHLAGDALKPKTATPILRDGRAWGAAVAAFHSTGGRSTDEAAEAMLAALRKSLSEDAAEQREAGVYLAEEHVEAERRLTHLLAHYTGSAGILPIDRIEHELVAPIPSRTGRRRSSRYRFQAYLDGVHVDEEGRSWVVEFKLRGRLSPFDQIVLSRQTRFYAWAWREATGVEPAGVIVDERLNEIPSEVAYNQDGRLSKRQGCDARAYLNAGGSDPDVLAKLESKDWQRRHFLLLRPDELDEAGRQLVSLAQQVRLFDSGDLLPVRNPSPARCPGCRYRDVCPNPDDEELIDALYLRRPPKRDREAVMA
jgi:hypothetical protein